LDKQGPELIDPRLARALEHPIRIEILGVLQEEPSSPTRIQRRLETVSLNLVSHHMKVLKELGCIELVEEVSRRGAKEHIYRIVETPVVTDEEWAALTPKMRQPLTAAVLRLISHDLARSLGTGRFQAASAHHLSRTPLKLDQQGRSEMAKLLERTLEEVIAIGSKSAKRAKAGNEAPVPVTVAILHFPTGEAKDESDSEP
jgi:DNA-binding transcriptional ArsR family regulator